MKIMFVCTGNTCRSPMAEALYRQSSTEAGRHDEVRSRAATTCYLGDRVLGRESLSASILLQEYGLDISQHLPTAISSRDIEWSDLILAMENKHVKELKTIFIGGRNLGLDTKLHTFGDYIGLRGEEVEDPMEKEEGKTEAYRECAKQLDSWTNILVKKFNVQGKN
jgi:protein-tyrosine-phosphatase